MWLKFGVAKLLCICIDLTKFEENPEGLSFFCVDLSWNDPSFTVSGKPCKPKRVLITYKFHCYVLAQSMIAW